MGGVLGGAVNFLAFMPPNTKAAQASNQRIKVCPHLKVLRTMEGNNISCIYIPQMARPILHHPARPQPVFRDSITILFSHGNAETLGQHYDFLLSVAKHFDCSVFSYDYSGYGLSDGTPSEESCYHDINAAFHFLTNIQNIPRHQIVVWGRSLGGGPSTDLASRVRGLGGLVLQSAFSSAVRCRMPEMVAQSMADIDIFINQVQKLNFHIAVETSFYVFKISYAWNSACIQALFHASDFG